MDKHQALVQSRVSKYIAKDQRGQGVEGAGLGVDRARDGEARGNKSGLGKSMPTRVSSRRPVRRVLLICSKTTDAWICGAAVLALLSANSVAQGVDPLVLNHSQRLNGAGSTASGHIVGGSNAAVNAFNRAVGVGGRHAKHETVDAGNDSASDASSPRKASVEKHPIAFGKFLCDSACTITFSAARATQIAPIRPLSEVLALRSIADTQLYRIRPDVTL
jgi:hypothetical protein